MKNLIERILKSGKREVYRGVVTEVRQEGPRLSFVTLQRTDDLGVDSSTHPLYMAVWPEFLGRVVDIIETSKGFYRNRVLEQEIRGSNLGQCNPIDYVSIKGIEESYRERELSKKV
ncbi:MAG: hypothetical protein KC506_02400 [Nanoarchaeota archaeon]|nr:hypothetical protein [Nanoarchaeota archaeon]